jgi:hypothetical protein
MRSIWGRTRNIFAFKIHNKLIEIEILILYRSKVWCILNFSSAQQSAKKSTNEKITQGTLRIVVLKKKDTKNERVD